MVTTDWQETASVRIKTNAGARAYTLALSQTNLSAKTLMDHMNAYAQKDSWTTMEPVRTWMSVMQWTLNTIVMLMLFAIISTDRLNAPVNLDMPEMAKFAPILTSAKWRTTDVR
jgi:hypothetical protein